MQVKREVGGGMCVTQETVEKDRFNRLVKLASF